MSVSSDNNQIAIVEHCIELDSVVEGVARIGLAGARTPQIFENDEGASSSIRFYAFANVQQ
jgi:hypothetical protein